MMEVRTPGSQRYPERQKARARFVLLTLVGIICPPLAGVRSAAVWVLYVVLAVAYSLWALRLARNFSQDRRLGYLLCLTDGAILLPLLVWSSAAALQAVLLLLWGVGALFTYIGNKAQRSGRVEAQRGLRPAWTGSSVGPHWTERPEAPLERALRVRLRVFQTSKTRFALVMLRIARFEEMGTYYGAEAAERLIIAVTRRGLRLLGPDAQSFRLDEGRVAFLFATGAEVAAASAKDGTLGWIDPYDVETVAMTVGRRACEHLIDGHRVECVVGWASAPADGLTADDLLYAAETGAKSTDAFRRVAGSRVPVPERARAAAG